MIRIILLSTAVFFFIFFPLHNLSAKPLHTFKIASLAPEGSVWVNSFKEFANEVAEETNGDVVFRIYPGGIMGDDKAMYRKMRVGQLHGGGFTMTGIADIVADFRVMAIPFLFKSYEEVDGVRTAMIPFFEKIFAEKSLQFLAFTEVGFIYTFSTKPKATIKDLQKGKTWAPSNDPLTTSFLKSLDISPITLTIPDVLSSLQSGLIDTAFNSLYGSIVLQWFTKAPYVTDQPYGYAYGAFILSQKAFLKLSKDQQDTVKFIATKYFDDLILKTRQSNDESRDVLTNHGVTFIRTSSDEVKKLEQHRDITIKKLTGSSFSEEAYNTLNSELIKIRTRAD